MLNQGAIRALVGLALGASLFVACGSERAPGVNNATVTPTGDACATPNDGCPCETPDQIVECGRVSHRGPDGYVACSMGKRKCEGGRWGTCIGETDVTIKTYVAGGGPNAQNGGLQIKGLGPSQACPATGPLSNPCNPFCNHFVDDTDGGLDAAGVRVNDSGGIVIDPAVDGGTSVGGSFVAPKGGVSECSPNRNLDGNGGAADCSATPLTTCQQDFRCDPATRRCLWNGNTAYSDPAAGGVDLTVQAPCGPQGAGTANVVVCNRGSAPAPAGSAINLFVTTGASPPDTCTNLGAPTVTRTLGAALAPGACTTLAGIGNSMGAKFISVNAGNPGAIVEGPGRCANNSAYFRTDGSAGDCALCNSCVTTLTGTIFDPRGVNPLPGVTVYVPTANPSALPSGVACDTCASLVTGNPWSITTTDFRGQFSITVPGNANFPLIVQAGRWRRRLQIKAIPACPSTTVALATHCASGCTQFNPTTSTYTACVGAECGHLPQNKAEGDIPLTALVTGEGDQLECLFRKIGIDDAEFTTSSGTGRIHLYRDNGMNWSSTFTRPAMPTRTALWGNATTGVGATFNNYASIISPCDNHPGGSPLTGPSSSPAAGPPAQATALQQVNMRNYLDAGGRLFATHWYSHDWVETQYPAAVDHLYGSAVDADRESYSSPAAPLDSTVDTSTPVGKTFADWLDFVNASPGGPGTVRFNSWRHLSVAVNAGVTRFAFANSNLPPLSRPQNTSVWGGPMVTIYGFETPYNTPGACGRVMMAQSHVTNLSSTNRANGFPTGCGSASTAMTAQEKAFEFLIFNSQACLGAVPVVPPPTTPDLATTTFTRDYLAVCPFGHRPKWDVFYWQANIPTAVTRIDFRAATAASQAALPAAPGTDPTSRAIGAATTTTTSPAWNCNGCPGAPVTVDYQLRTAAPPPNSPSMEWLRVYMTFTPDNSVSPKVSPSLTSWRQTYSCVPGE